MSTAEISQHGKARYADIAALIVEVEDLQRDAQEAAELYLARKRALREEERKAAGAAAAGLGLKAGPAFSIEQLKEGRARRHKGDTAFDFASYDQRQDWLWKDDAPAAVVNHASWSWEENLAWAAQRGLRIECLEGSWIGPADRIAVLVLGGDPA